MILESVEECAVTEEFGRKVGYAWPLAILPCLFYCALYYRMNDQVRLWNLDVLLQM